MYKPTDKMSELMCAEPQTLSIIARFGLPMGVAEKTIEEVCREHQVDIDTFLAVVNYTTNKTITAPEFLSAETLVHYLQAAHTYFLDFALPTLRRKLIEAVNTATNPSRIPLLIIQCFDDYIKEIQKHMVYENQYVFPYIQALLQNQKPEYDLDVTVKQHSAENENNIASKLTELKNLIVKYYPSDTANNLLNSALYDIFLIEKEITTHCAIEDNLLVPCARLLTKKHLSAHAAAKDEDGREELSDREKDVLIKLVDGLSNKEIADALCISVHTVITHRKNIARKLQIHSPAGLTIYAIVHHLVDINSLKE